MRKNKRYLTIQYFHRFNRPILIGEISSLLKISLEKAETMLDNMANETNPEIRLALPDELKGTDIKLAYVLVGKAIPALAYEP